MNHTLALATELPGMPAPPPPAVPAARVSLLQCLVLAALLHAWLVALVGTAPGPGVDSGGGLGRAIQIRLAGPGPQDSAGAAERPLPPSGPVGRAAEPRYGGAVSDKAPLPAAEPGAAQLGVWKPQTQPDDWRTTAAPSPPRSEPGAAAAPQAITRSEPRPDARREPALDGEPRSPSVPEPSPVAPPEAISARSTAPRLTPSDAAQAPLLQRNEQAARDIAHSARVPAPVAQEQPAPRRDEPSATAAGAAENPATAATAIERPTPTSVPAPVEALPRPPAPLAPPAPQPTSAESPRQVPSAVSAAEPAPLPAPSVPQPRVQPLSTQRPVEASELPRLAAPEVSAPAVQVTEPAQPPALPAPPSAVAAGGSPDAGARTGAERASAPSASASTPRLNLEMPRARGGAPALVMPRALNLVPPPPDRKSALQEGIEKAGKTDCRKAYAGMGVLAVVPLAADALRDGGCRW